MEGPRKLNADALELLFTDAVAGIEVLSISPLPEKAVMYLLAPLVGDAKGLSGRLCSKLHFRKNNMRIRITITYKKEKNHKAQIDILIGNVGSLLLGILSLMFSFSPVNASTV